MWTHNTTSMSIFDFSECKLVWCAVLCVGVVSSLKMWQQRLVTAEADLAVTQLIIIPPSCYSNLHQLSQEQSWVNCLVWSIMLCIVQLLLIVWFNPRCRSVGMLCVSQALLVAERVPNPVAPWVGSSDSEPRALISCQEHEGDRKLYFQDSGKEKKGQREVLINQKNQE